MSQVIENILKKHINRLISSSERFDWAKGVHLIKLEEQPDKSWEGRILIDVKPEYFTHELDKGNYNFNEEENAWLYYGLELRRFFKDRKYIEQVHYLPIYIDKLFKNMGFIPHYSLFNVFYCVTKNEDIMENLIKKVLKEDIEEQQEKKRRAKNLIKKMLETKTTEPSVLEDDWIKLEKNGNRQLEYNITNISTFGGQIHTPMLAINYHFFMNIVDVLPIKEILDSDEIVHTIIDWFNHKFHKKVNPNSWQW